MKSPTASTAEGRRPWLRVVFGAECDVRGNCPVCKDIDFADCPCPGPTQADEFEYRTHRGELQARRRATKKGRPSGRP